MIRMTVDKFPFSQIPTNMDTIHVAVNTLAAKSPNTNNKTWFITHSTVGGRNPAPPGIFGTL